MKRNFAVLEAGFPVFVAGHGYQKGSVEVPEHWKGIECVLPSPESFLFLLAI